MLLPCYDADAAIDDYASLRFRRLSPPFSMPAFLQARCLMFSAAPMLCRRLFFFFFADDAPRHMPLPECAFCLRYAPLPLFFFFSARHAIVAAPFMPHMLFIFIFRQP